MSVYQAILEAARTHPEGDPRELATAIVARHTKSDLIPFIAEEIKGQQREVQRRVEDEAFIPMREHFREASLAMPTPDEMASLENFRALYRTPFRLGDGTTATWGSASLDQHERRLSMLLKLRAGLDKTIERHQEAIRILKATGAPCLEEVRIAS